MSQQNQRAPELNLAEEVDGVAFQRLVGRRKFFQPGKQPLDFPAAQWPSILRALAFLLPEGQSARPLVRVATLRPAGRCRRPEPETGRRHAPPAPRRCRAGTHDRFAATRRASDRRLKKIGLLFFKSGRGLSSIPVPAEYSIDPLRVGVESVNVGARVRTIASSPFKGAA